MKHVLSVIGATLALSNAALAQSSTPAGKPIPPMPQWYDDAKACRWEWLEGRDMGLWAQRCNVTGAIWHLVYDPEADGFVLHVENDAELDRDFTTMVVRQFRNPQGPLAVLPELKSRGLVRDDPECAMEEDAGTPLPKGWKAYQVNPTGKRGAAYNQALERHEPAGAPCGQFGVFGLENEEETFFIAHQTHPDRLLYVNVGANDHAEADPDPSEAERTQTGQLFDISTITFRD